MLRLTVNTKVTKPTGTSVPVDYVEASSSILAGCRGTFVNVHFTVGPSVARVTGTNVASVCVKAVSIWTADAVGTLINIKVAVVVGEPWCTGTTEVVEQVGASCSVQTGV